MSAEDSMPKEPSSRKMDVDQGIPMLEKKDPEASNDPKQIEDSGEGIVLQQKLSLVNGITVIVGSIIGSGIFVSPRGVLAGSGSVGMSLIVWLLSGIYSMIGAYCYAELGTSIVRSGADYAYIFEAFGPFLAFLRLWVECMIVRPCSQAIVALTFAAYVIEPLFPDCEQPDVAVRLLAVVCIMVLTFVNCASVEWATRVQDVFTYAKLLALALIIVTGIVQLGRGEVEYFKEPFANTETDIGQISLAFYSGLFAYNGWNYLNFVIEELKDPYKNLPKAIWISIILVTVVYVFTNIAYFSTVSPEEVLGGAAVAVMFSKRLYGVMWWCMPVFVSLSTFGGVNGILFTTSRLFYVGGREGHMPKILSMVQIQRLTPMPAVLFMGLLSLCYLASSDIYALINYVGFATWLSIGMAIVVLLYLRWKRPEMHRPIKVALIWPIIYTIVTIYLVILPLYASPTETGIGLLIICTGIPVYIIFVAWTSKPKIFDRYMDNMTTFLQKVFMVVAENKKKD
ncbi:Y+L amino acid transporter 2-like [Aplysia californica]|uniref:Y+L amino acid transporter 2 n=1 Tax=Aplysia californica TaxID=6500 RepID=A0ABM1W431_APLCA|nr:Y+L amino acid transporter 2 [Aplysia californica]XP_035829424.1 Y+L amino acid transporter 2-like [Aplysia californica]